MKNYKRISRLVVAVISLATMAVSAFPTTAFADVTIDNTITVEEFKEAYLSYEEFDFTSDQRGGTNELVLTYTQGDYQAALSAYDKIDPSGEDEDKMFFQEIEALTTYASTATLVITFSDDSSLIPTGLGLRINPTNGYGEYLSGQKVSYEINGETYEYTTPVNSEDSMIFITNPDGIGEIELTTEDEFIAGGVYTGISYMIAGEIQDNSSSSSSVADSSSSEASSSSESEPDSSSSVADSSSSQLDSNTSSEIDSTSTGSSSNATSSTTKSRDANPATGAIVTISGLILAAGALTITKKKQ